jgi:hypothetical protein
MNYKVTYIYGERDNETTIEIYDVKTVAYDKDVVVFFGINDKPIFILKHDKFYISRIC